ncbi:MAG: hypothetical protein LAN71_02195 [Acidobacteriia bacterium]|nr:hypothetical protein [Terriglobia bacterium]
MAKKPTTADAELILRLYDLRREAELRKARSWGLIQFWPESADDYLKVGMALGTQENAWLRQVLGYWDMAASLVLRGALNADLFLEGASSGEMFFLFCKIQPHLKEIREKMQNPKMMANIEKVIYLTKESRERFEMLKKIVASRRQAMKAAAAKTS